MDDEIKRLRELYVLNELQRDVRAAAIIETIVWTLLIVAATALLMLLLLE